MKPSSLMSANVVLPSVTNRLRTSSTNFTTRACSLENVLDRTIYEIQEIAVKQNTIGTRSRKRLVV